jgi:hypothetical protein
MSQENEKEFMQDLKEAHEASERALNSLYGPLGVKRSLRYRLRLQRAQNALISLYVRDLNRKRGK